MTGDAGARQGPEPASFSLVEIAVCAMRLALEIKFWGVQADISWDHYNRRGRSIDTVCIRFPSYLPAAAFPRSAVVQLVNLQILLEK
jgi:hypothetical protein